jgi:transcriptional regulator with XRE-family HTH domain
VNFVERCTDRQSEVLDIRVPETLQRARVAHGEELAALAKRIGVRQEHLCSIEEGRFADLPPGIYGRAAVKSFATAYGFDGAEVLAACESLLPSLDEPISALARLRGLRPSRAEALPPMPAVAPAHISLRDRVRRRQPSRTVLPADSGSNVCPSWRVLAAAAVDACVIVTLLMIVVASALTALTATISALDRSAPAFGVMGVLLGFAYFGWFGGLGGTTPGERLFRGEPRPADVSLLTLQAIALRAMESATLDVRFIHQVGAWIGRFTATEKAHVNREDMVHVE